MSIAIGVVAVTLETRPLSHRLPAILMIGQSIPLSSVLIIERNVQLHSYSCTVHSILLALIFTISAGRKQEVNVEQCWILEG